MWARSHTDGDISGDTWARCSVVAEQVDQAQGPVAGALERVGHRGRGRARVSGRGGALIARLGSRPGRPRGDSAGGNRSPVRRQASSRSSAGRAAPAHPPLGVGLDQVAPGRVDPGRGRARRGPGRTRRRRVRASIGWARPSWAASTHSVGAVGHQAGRARSASARFAEQGAGHGHRHLPGRRGQGVEHAQLQPALGSHGREQRGQVVARGRRAVGQPSSWPSASQSPKRSGSIIGHAAARRRARTSMTRASRA